MQFYQAIVGFREWRSLKKVKPATVRGYDLALRNFCVFLRNPEIEEIKLDNVVEWFALQEQLGWDSNGFLIKAVAIRKILEFYRHQGLDVMDPWFVPIPEVEYRKPRVISEDNYVKLLATIPKDGKDPRHIRNEALIRLLHDSGVRNSEVTSLDVSDLDLINMRATIRTKKARSHVPMRQIFWTPDTNEALKMWIERREILCQKRFFPGDELFISITGKKCGQRLENAGVSQMLRKYSRDGKIFPVVNAHSFRHAFGEDLAEEGVNDATISSLMGHSSITSSFIYTRLNDQAKERVYRKHHAEDKRFGKLPAKVSAPTPVVRKRNWAAERAAQEARQAQRKIEYEFMNKMKLRSVEA